MKKHLTLLLVLTAACSVSAVTVFDSNFDSLSTGALADNASIGTNLTARIGTNVAINAVDQGSGNMALELTDNSTTAVGSNYPLIKGSITGVSTSGTGNNLLAGSFDLTLLQTGIPFQFFIQSLNQEGLSGANAQSQIRVSTTGLVSYSNGITFFNTSLTLTSGTVYKFSYNIDLSSATQDTWSFTVVATSAPGTTLAGASGLNTGIANGTPGVAIFNFGSNAASSSSSAAYRIDNITLDATSAIPEPSTYAAFGGLTALAGAMMLRRRRRS